jgi:hypothetical protein
MIQLKCANGHVLRPSVVFDAKVDQHGSMAIVSLETACGVHIDLDCVEGCADEAFSEDLDRRVMAVVWGALEGFGGIAVRVQTCRICGCSDGQPCGGGCSWIQPDLCSQCDENLAIAGAA